MKLSTLTRSLVLGTALTLLGTSGAFALTDEEALAEGMTPIEEYLMSEMQAVVTPGLNREGVLRAAKTHRFVIAINKSSTGPDAQTMTVYENGVEVLKEKVSTGREKQEKAKSGRVYLSTTPKGFFRPTKIYKDYMSYTWKAPMPNAVFFVGGIAIHATTAVQDLGKRASGGCVRTKQEVSQWIREKVMDTGLGSQPGQYKIVREDAGRNRITNNTISVDQVNRNTGDLLNTKVNSWDTVIVVYED